MRLTDTNRFYLNVLGNRKRWLHLATIQKGLREYMCFADTSTGLTYIEEITSGVGPDRIEDDALAADLENFLIERGVLRYDKPLLPDNEWLR